MCRQRLLGQRRHVPVVVLAVLVPVVRVRFALAAGPTLLLLRVWMRERVERRERE